MKRIYSVANTKHRAIIIIAKDENEAANIARIFGHIKNEPVSIKDTTDGWPQYSREAIKEVVVGESGWASVKIGPESGYQWTIMTIDKRIINHTFYTRK